MVLAVSQIFWTYPDAAKQEVGLDGQPAPMPDPYVSGLELTDGWYRILANVDPVLGYAAQRGKISIGTKIEMTGSRVRPFTV